MSTSDERSEIAAALTPPQISLCMIVRDNEGTIVPCLESIRPWVGEIIVVDTGSLDQTPRICESFGAKVFHFPWIDDFSAARNVSLRHATGKWIFWMDSDDTIDEPCGRQLREIARAEHPEQLMGFVMQVHCPGPEDELQVVDHVKLFRNRPEIRFEGRIHEQIIRSIRELRGAIAWSDVFVRHSGCDITSEGKKRKIERDLRILQKDLAERPNHPFVLFNLGMTFGEAQEHAQAVEWLERCLRVSSPDQTHLRKTYALLAMSLTQLGRIKEAVEACARGRQFFPLDAELLFRQGILADQMGQYPEAIAAFRGAIASREPRYFSGFDPGIKGFKARNNMALAYQRNNQHDLAEMQWRTILTERTQFSSAWRGLGQTLLSAGRHETIRIEIERRQDELAMRANSLLIEAKLLQSQGDQTGARQRLEQAAKEFPDDPVCQEALAQFLVQHEEWNAAQSTLSHLTELIPDDGAAWHNLAVVFYHLGRRDRAVAAFQQSLRVRPQAPHTQELLRNLMTELPTAA